MDFMHTQFKSKVFYTEKILSGVNDVSKLAFLKKKLQRYIYITGAFNAHRVKPANVIQTIKTIRESGLDKGKIRNLTHLFHEEKGIHIASGFFEYGGEYKYGKFYRSFNSFLKHLNPFKKSVPIAWLISNNHTQQIPVLNFLPQHDVYFLTDPFYALRLVQMTSVQARKLTHTDDNLRMLMSDFSSGERGLINTLYNEDDLKILARKIDLDLDFNHYQFDEKDWVNDYSHPENEKPKTSQKQSNIDILIYTFTKQRETIGQIVLITTLNEMKKVGAQVNKNNPFEQIVQFMRLHEIGIIVELTPTEILLNDGEPIKLTSLKRAFHHVAKDVELK